jgi:hypothetical protein
MMAIPAGTTANLTWRTDGVTVAITPQGGSTTTFSVPLDRVASSILAMVEDDTRGASVVTKINQALAAAKENRAGYSHIRM